MLVAVGGDKGAPGATTFAVLLGLLWPGAAVVAELDLRGPSLPFRMTRVDGGPLSRSPSLASLAVDARPGGSPPAVDSYAQLTRLGVSVIPGPVPVPNELYGAGEPVAARTRAAVTRHLPAIADAARVWCDTVIADVGALLPGTPVLPVVRAAQLTLLVTRPTAEGLGRLWERASELAAVTQPGQLQPGFGIVLVAPISQRRAAERRARAVLDLVGCPAPVVGTVAVDERAAEQLWTAGWSPRFSRSALYRSAQELVSAIMVRWPQLRPHASVDSPADVCADVHVDGDPDWPRSDAVAPAMLGWPTAGDGTGP